MDICILRNVGRQDGRSGPDVQIARVAAVTTIIRGSRRFLARSTGSTEINLNSSTTLRQPFVFSVFFMPSMPSVNNAQINAVMSG